MGIMGMFKWLRKDHSADRNKENVSPPPDSLNNEAYRNALQAFLERRRSIAEPGFTVSPCSPDKKRLDFLTKKNNNDKKNYKSEKHIIPGVPHIQPSEIFEIGWVAGTEDRYLELISAEWQNTRIVIKRHTHPECLGTVMADIAILTEIRHPNILLLMATTESVDHGLMEICEFVDCTLYNYLHDKGERVSVQETARCIGKVAEALRHALMRGFVHGAISSHCIYLTQGGSMKLGGWEMAKKKYCTKPTTQIYEDRLQTEIFRWLAPEIFRGTQPSEVTDIYGLAVVIWEVCTMQVPWSNLTKAEVEKQFRNQKQGVELESYNFPPLLYNILEKGLQIDADKRTLDMNRMRRFLQCLEMQYENEELIFVESRESNNNEKSIIPESPKSVTKIGYSDILKSQNIYEVAKTPRTRSYTKKEMQVERINVCPVEESKQGKVPERKESFVLIKPRKNSEEKNEDNMDTRFSAVSSPLEEHVKTSKDKVLSVYESSIEDERQDDARNNAGYESSDSCVTTNSTRTIESSADESLSDTRNNIRKLKEALAAKREKFFSTDTVNTKLNDTPTLLNSIVDTVNNDLKFDNVRSQNYKAYKPASHVVSYEPKLNKSFSSEYDPSLIKPANHKHQKSHYAYLPSQVKEAVIQPQLLNESTQSFLESSWWRKEKKIIESKMSKESISCDEMNNSQCLSVSNSNKNQEEQRKSPVSNETFTIDESEAQSAEDNLKENDTQDESLSPRFSTDNFRTRSMSLHALKEALNRATNIVRSTTPESDGTVKTIEHSTQAKTLNSPKIPETNSKAQENLFQDLFISKLGNDELGDEIKSIEKDTKGETSFLLDSISKIDEEGGGEAKATWDMQSLNCDDTTYYSFNVDRISNFVCESIPEHFTEEQEFKEKEVKACKSQSSWDKNSDNGKTAMFRDREHDTCTKCTHRNVLVRRRSLPAALNALKSSCSSSIGKLPIRRVPDVPDNTLEDIYIDDEFDEQQLTINMILHDEVLMDDENEFLTESVELQYCHIHDSLSKKP